MFYFSFSSTQIKNNSSMDEVVEAVEKANKEWEEVRRKTQQHVQAIKNYGKSRNEEEKNSNSFTKLNGLAQDGLSLLNSLQFQLDLLAPQLPTDDQVQAAKLLLQSWNKECSSLHTSLRDANLQAKANVTKAAQEQRELLVGGEESTVHRHNLQTKAGVTYAAESVAESLRRTRQLMVQEVERSASTLMTFATASSMTESWGPISSQQWTENSWRMLSPPPSPPPRKVRLMVDILAEAKYAVVEQDSYSDIICEQCGSGNWPDELLLCDKCDRGFHMKCLRPIVVRVPIGSWFCPSCSGQRRRKIIDFFKIEKCNASRKEGASPQDARKRRRRSTSLVLQKKRRRLLPFIPSEDPVQRLKQMGTLASALMALQMEFSDELTYRSGMAPRSANQAMFENGGMQVLSKEDTETLEQCRAMSKRGECPPLVVVYDSCEGYTVEADGQIKDMTFIAEYCGDVDFLNNREHDDCDSMMTLLLATDPSKSLVICPDKRGNIARFINGINNHTPESKKKQNCKCVRYSVKGECRVFLVATRDIAKGEKLYYDYNGYEHEYPTHHFV